MQKIAIFGKGGTGKSTIITNLAAVYAKQGKKVLLLGCDPKHDTSLVLTDGYPIPSVMQSIVFHGAGGLLEDIVVRGRLGIDCIEAGGPEPGVGCAGRGISRMLEILAGSKILESKRYDVVLFDVLGDVVCGGFAAPLRQGFAEKVCIVVSEELLSLYAANNISRAIKTFSSNGVSLAGLVANMKNPKADRRILRRFARGIGTTVLTFLPHESVVQEAQYHSMCVVEYAPDLMISSSIKKLARKLWLMSPDSASVPVPLSDSEFCSLFPYGSGLGTAAGAKVLSSGRQNLKIKRHRRRGKTERKKGRHK